MGKILAAVFGLMMVMAGVGMDYVMFAQKANGAGTPAGVSDYIANMQTRFDDSTTKEPELDLAAFLPAPTEGWTRLPFAENHGELITGVAFDKDLTDENTINDLQRSFLESRRPPSRVADVYQKGDQLVALRLTFAAGGKMSSFKRKMQAMAAEDALEAAKEVDSNLYGLIRGVLLTNLPQPVAEGQTAPAYRLFTAQLADEISVLVLTNADDETLQSVVGRIDIAGLNALLAEPVAFVAAEKPVLWDAEARVAFAAEEAAAKAPSTAEGTTTEGAAPVASAETGQVEKPQTCVRRAGVKTCS